MLELNLKYCKRVSFNQSEATNFLEFIQENPELAANMGPNDVVCFISLLEDQYVFVRAFQTFEDSGKKYRVLPSSRNRIDGGKWSHRMIANYAELVGIRLIGRKRLEDALAEEEAEKDRTVKRKRREAKAATHAHANGVAAHS